MSKVLGEAINYQKLRVDGYDLEYIKDLKIESNINEHSVLKFTGVLKNDLKDDDVYQTSRNKIIEVYYEESERNTIFFGIVTNIEIDVNKDVYLVHIEAKSMTYLMDIKVKSRSFQDKSMMTHSVVDYIMKEYGNKGYVLNMPSEPVGELLVQYEETDWEFIKRIASKYNLGLIPRININNIAYVMGLSDDAEKEKCIIKQQEMYKSLEEYEYMQENYFNDASEMDYLTCKIISNDIVNIGKSVSIFNQNFYVYSAVYEIENSVLVNTYKLRLKNGIRQNKIYNTKVIGSAIRGNIIGVKNDLVQIHLDIDDNYKDKNDVYWFKFSTMSASSDGSGWYYMPEVGDSVRVYFPTKDEDECFAISAVSKYIQGAGETQDRMADPDTKYLRTPTDKEVRLTNDGIYVSCNSGQGTMSFTSDGNLNISSANDINIIASKSIEISAKNDFKMTAENDITIYSEQGGVYCITPEGDIIQSGTQLENN